MHSATKWLGGHGTSIGGAIVDAGRFDWETAGKFPTLSEPYEGYHGIDFAEEFGPQAFLMRARAEGLRDFGAAMSPANAFQLLQGVETLPLRMTRHVENTRAILAFLAACDDVAWLNRPELAAHPDHALAQPLMPHGAGSVLCFGIKGGRAAGKLFIDRLKLVSHLANVGDAKTLVIHPASATHQRLDAASLAAAGVGEDLVRLSVGLEDPADIIADLDQALHAARRSTRAGAE